MTSLVNIYTVFGHYDRLLLFEQLKLDKYLLYNLKLGMFVRMACVCTVCLVMTVAEMWKSKITQIQTHMKQWCSQDSRIRRVLPHFWPKCLDKQKRVVILNTLKSAVLCVFLDIILPLSASLFLSGRLYFCTS